jgi:hypothetical protein
LRRADDQPLGLEVIPDTFTHGLVVKAIWSGSVAEAWNKQNFGELREIRPSDRVISVNDVVEAAAMWEECKRQSLLKMVFERDGAVDEAPDRVMNRRVVKNEDAADQGGEASAKEDAGRVLKAFVPGQCVRGGRVHRRHHI